MNKFDSPGYFQWLWTQRKKIIIVQLIAITVSAIFSSPYFIPPQFKSYAIVYPYNLNQYSKETETEQMLQFLNSTDIKNEVIAKFNLTKHYRIDTTNKKWHAKVLDEFDKSVSSSATEFEAIEIKAYDISPDTACEIIQEIVNAMNRKIQIVQRGKSLEVSKMLQNYLFMKKREIDSLTFNSNNLSTSYGLIDYPNEARELSRAYFEVLSGTKAGKGANDVTEEMKNMEQKGIEFWSVNQHIVAAVNDYDAILAKYDEAIKDANKQFTYTNMVESPYPSNVVAYPERIVIVLLTCFCSFILSVIVIRILEKVST